MLLGSNVFARKISILKNADIRESLRRQIIEYFWRLDHWYLGDYREVVLIDKFTKYLVRIAQDLLVTKGDISFGEINVLSHKKFIKVHLPDKSYLSEDTKQGFEKIGTDAASIEELVQLKESLYEDFRELFIV